MARRTINYYHDVGKGGFGGAGRGHVKKHHGKSNNFSLGRNARCP